MSIDEEVRSIIPVNFTSCEQEPIHISGAIQQHGVLFALEETTLTILQVSRNVVDFFHVSPETLLNKSLETLFEQSQISLLRQALNVSDLQAVNPLKLTVQRNGRERIFDGILHRSDGLLILELEDVSTTESISPTGLYTHLRTAIPRFSHAQSLNELCAIVAQEVRTITGLDRVMVYQFDKEWNGTVIAEEKLASLESFLTLRFPASDIPRQARQLYLKNWLRLIANVAYQPSVLTPSLNPLTQRPLDMSFSVLRSVSPMHIEYLKNMGVQASMSISLIKENVLWGLIVCHHNTPKYISHDIRTACEFLGQIASALLSAKQDNEDHQYEMQVKSMLTQLLGTIAREENAVAGLMKYGTDVLAMVHAQGLAVCAENQYHTLGPVPNETNLKHLVTWLGDNCSDDVFYTTSLAEIYPEAETIKDVASGILAVRISKLQGGYILCFRPEVIQTVNWGGDPNVSTEVGPHTSSLHPRKSFEQWKETIRSTSLPWKLCEIQAAGELRAAIVDMVLRDMLLQQTLGSWLNG